LLIKYLNLLKSIYLLLYCFYFYFFHINHYGNFLLNKFFNLENMNCKFVILLLNNIQSICVI
jgi:hypothetical protein